MQTQNMLITEIHIPVNGKKMLMKWGILKNSLHLALKILMEIILQIITLIHLMDINQIKDLLVFNMESNIEIKEKIENDNNKSLSIAIYLFKNTLNIK